LLSTLKTRLSDRKAEKDDIIEVLERIERQKDEVFLILDRMEQIYTKLGDKLKRWESDT
jgi:predicted nuclease with TOPRIM domain